MSEIVQVALLVLFGNFLVVAANLWVQRQARPNANKTTQAQVAQEDAETQGIKDANDNKRYEQYTKMSADVMRMMDELRTQKRTIGNQDAEIVAFNLRVSSCEAENAMLKTTVSTLEEDRTAKDQLIQALTDRAEKAEKALAIYAKWVPSRIEALEAEVRRSHEVVSANASARQTEAETANELAKSAEAQRVTDLATMPTEGAPQEGHDSTQDKTVAVKITGELLDKKP